MRRVETPLIVAGGPLRDRGWIAHEWLIGLLQQDYPAAQLKIACLVNDSQDDTLEICQWFAQQFPQRVFVREQNFGVELDGNLRAGRSMEHMALLRNTWLEWVREEWDPALFWTTDSDVIFAAETLRSLVEADKDLVAPMIQFWPEWHTNALFWRDPQVGLAEGFRWNPETYDRYELFLADFVCATPLIKRRVFDAGVRWRGHEQGEDAALAWDCTQAGFQMFCEGRLRADHRLRKYGVDLQQSERATALLADYWRWRHGEN